MSRVRLTGLLACSDVAQTTTVAEHLPRHIELTRSEPGCLLFEVTRTDDPLVWRVEELFAGDAEFAAHQARVAASDWGRAISGIERRYTVVRD